jgi:hypothetical protein
MDKDELYKKMEEYLLTKTEAQEEWYAPVRSMNFWVIDNFLSFVFAPKIETVEELKEIVKKQQEEIKMLRMTRGYE